MDEFEDTMVGGAPAQDTLDDYPPTMQGFEEEGALDAANGIPDEGFAADAPAAYTTAAGYEDAFAEPAVAPFGATVHIPEVHQEAEQSEPRLAWSRANAETLLLKAQAEEQAKKELLQKAQEHVEKFYQGRKQSTASRLEHNREDELQKSAERVPTTGTAWEKITAMINFGFEVHQKDVQRYKACLMACKAGNVAVRS